MTCDRPSGVAGGVAACVALAACLTVLPGLTGCQAEATKAPPKIKADPPPRSPQATLEHLARTDHVALLQRCLRHYRRNYEGFVCTFRKQERIDGQLRPEQTVRVKFRDEPFSVAMEWVENAPLGDRLLYVEGKYEGKMLIRPSFALLRGMTVKRDPWGQDVQKQTLRPVTGFGFQRAMEGLIETYQQAREKGELETGFDGYARIDDRRCLVLVRELPDKPEYPAPRTVIYIDTERLVPMGIRAFEADDTLQASYIYENVELNPGLTDQDFTPEANDMAKPG